ncbi:MAG: hypothetical protein M5U28_36045 [Sandaracinaceae bacterium]|nr:hypothetical protein [Sandaracinaceae bacterium]
MRSTRTSRALRPAVQRWARAQLVTAEALAIDAERALLRRERADGEPWESADTARWEGVLVQCEARIARIRAALHEHEHSRSPWCAWDRLVGAHLRHLFGDPIVGNVARLGAPVLGDARGRLARGCESLEVRDHYLRALVAALQAWVDRWGPRRRHGAGPDDARGANVRPRVARASPRHRPR